MISGCRIRVLLISSGGGAEKLNNSNSRGCWIQEKRLNNTNSLENLPAENGDWEEGFIGGYEDCFFQK